MGVIPMQKIKKFLLYFSIVFFVIMALFLLIFVPFIEQFTDLSAYFSMDIDSDACLENFTLIFPVYTYQGKPLEVRYVGLKPGSIKDYNISIVETEYGLMWKIEIKKINRSGRITFRHPYNVPIDVFDVKLKPKLDETIVKDEKKGRYYERIANLIIPVYIYYEGNVSEVRIIFNAYSGLDNIFGLIPSSPKHDGKVYAGSRMDKFMFDFKGWSVVSGKSKISIVYQ